MAGIENGMGVTAGAQTPSGEGTKGASMSNHARGTFEVKLAPVAVDNKDGGVSGSLTLDKAFQGDLSGSSRGQMWTAEAGVKGSGGYVAIEKVSGTLNGRSGTFTLLHQGTMKQGGDFKMTIVVVPDSGTGQLAGLSGAMTILITEGKHFYELDYALPQTP
jgi:hypothetical protein